eukprot:366024-Chlamydomonas_euryale.AAC.2
MPSGAQTAEFARKEEMLVRGRDFNTEAGKGGGGGRDGNESAPSASWLVGLTDTGNRGRRFCIQGRNGRLHA